MKGRKKVMRPKPIEVFHHVRITVWPSYRVFEEARCLVHYVHITIYLWLSFFFLFFLTVDSNRLREISIDVKRERQHIDVKIDPTRIPSEIQPYCNLLIIFWMYQRDLGIECVYVFVWKRKAAVIIPWRPLSLYQD